MTEATTCAAANGSSGTSAATAIRKPRRGMGDVMFHDAPHWPGGTGLIWMSVHTPRYVLGIRRCGSLAVQLPQQSFCYLAHLALKILCKSFYTWKVDQFRS